MYFDQLLGAAHTIHFISNHDVVSLFVCFFKIFDSERVKHMGKIANKDILTSKRLAEQAFAVEIHNTKNSVKAEAHSQKKLFLGGN